MSRIIAENGKLIYKDFKQTMTIEAWGEGALRVRATMADTFRPDAEAEQALLPNRSGPAQVKVVGNVGEIVNGRIKATVEVGLRTDEPTDAHEGRVVFYDLKTNRKVLEEYTFFAKFNSRGRTIVRQQGGLHKILLNFKSDRTEKLYGLGQHHNGVLDQKGCMIELRQRNRDIVVPFMISNRGYGFLWNMPGLGRFTSSAERTQWEADGAYHMDYWVTVGDTPEDILQKYMDATGKPPSFPKWGTGFWQCKLRYRTQDELLSVAREHKKRGLPMSVIVIDYFHWSKQGDWDFDYEAWPNPGAMVKELAEMGIKVMVSVWPTVSASSRNFDMMDHAGMLIESSTGYALFPFSETKMEGPQYVRYYDPFHPEARRFIWEQVKKNYFDRGIDVYWLDACEPDIEPPYAENYQYYSGPGTAVTNAYPLVHEMGFYKNMKEAGMEEVVNLCRSTWAGGQRYGAAVWSGDIPSTFGCLRKQIRSGLNMAMSGIPWWTTDIGGFTGGKIDDPEFRELLVRWFQWGAFSPIFRLHGYRYSEQYDMHNGSGADNEVWSYGNEAYEILTKFLEIREKFRPYLDRQFAVCSEKGGAIMRPLLYDFPGDEKTWDIEDEYMLGSDYLVAPVLEYKERGRQVYFPAGAKWTDLWTGKVYEGGSEAYINAGLDSIPLFARDGAHNPLS